MSKNNLGLDDITLEELKKHPQSESVLSCLNDMNAEEKKLEREYKRELKTLRILAKKTSNSTIIAELHESKKLSNDLTTFNN